MSPKKTGPRSLSEGLGALMRRLDREGKLSTERVLDVWIEVVGPEISSHTRVEGLREGELLVLTDSPAWASELSAMSGQLLERVRQAAGELPVRSIRFTVSRRVLEEDARHTRNAEVSRGYGGDLVTPEPLTDAERQAVERSVSAIENEALREAALRATIRDLEWKKAQETRNVTQRASRGPREPK